MYALIGGHSAGKRGGHHKQRRNGPLDHVPSAVILDRVDPFAGPVFDIDAAVNKSVREIRVIVVSGRRRRPEDKRRKHDEPGDDEVETSEETPDGKRHFESGDHAGIMNFSNVSTVVVAEPFSESGIAVLREHGIDVVSCVGGSKDDLMAALSTADGLIVRSETKVDRSLLEAAPKLAVVGRAGVGVDAIDVGAATAAGIVVLNTPAANTLAATEQTFALMLSLLRKTPDAVASIRAGRWERKPFVGRELAGKTLGIVGLGRIGGAVATRAAAFNMKLLATDPFISSARADAFGAQLVGLQELLGRAESRHPARAAHAANDRPHRRRAAALHESRRVFDQLRAGRRDR